MPIGTLSYRIEATEVTVAQFRAFKLKYGTQAGSPWAECPGKTAIGPLASCHDQTGGDSQPVNCVDFCDAKSYCAAIGRRLCGSLGGGRNSAELVNSAVSDQWLRACGGGSGTAFPYGADPDETRCSTSEAEAGAPREVGSRASCEGGEEGIFDMSGNVSEWEDACRTDASTNTVSVCVLRGGSYKVKVGSATCKTIVELSPQQSAEDIGFRCCADQ